MFENASLFIILIILVGFYGVNNSSCQQLTCFLLQGFSYYFSGVQSSYPMKTFPESRIQIKYKYLFDARGFPTRIAEVGWVSYFWMVFQKCHIKRRQSITFCCEFEFQSSLLASLKGKYLLGKVRIHFFSPPARSWTVRRL